MLPSPASDIFFSFIFDQIKKKAVSMPNENFVSAISENIHVYKKCNFNASASVFPSIIANRPISADFDQAYM